MIDIKNVQTADSRDNTLEINPKVVVTKLPTGWYQGFSLVHMSHKTNKDV